MSIRQRSNGSWIVRFREKDRFGKTHHRGKSFKTREEAEAFEMYVSAELTGTPDRPHSVWNPGRSRLPDDLFDQSSRPTFGSYKETWLDLKRFTSKSNLDGAQAALATTTVLDDIPLDKLRKSDIERWMAHESDRGQSPSSIRTYYRRIREVYNHALDDELIAKDRLRKVSLPKVSSRKTIAHYVTAEMARAIANAVQPRYRAVLLVEYLTGLRWSEVVALTTHDIRIWVSPDHHSPITEVDSVDGREGFLVVAAHVAAEGIVSGTKTDRDTSHTVPVDTFTLRLLAEHLAEFNSGDDGLVFANSRGSVLRSSNWSRDVTPKARAVAGNQFVGHDLRHSVAHDIEVIAGAKVAADLLNHSVAGSQTLSYTFKDSTAVADAVRVRGLQVAPVLWPEYASEEVAA